MLKQPEKKAPKTVYTFRIEGEAKYTAHLSKCIKKAKELKILLNQLNRIKIIPKVTKR